MSGLRRLNEQQVNLFRPGLNNLHESLKEDNMSLQTEMYNEHNAVVPRSFHHPKYGEAIISHKNGKVFQHIINNVRGDSHISHIRKLHKNNMKSITGHLLSHGWKRAD